MSLLKTFRPLALPPAHLSTDEVIDELKACRTARSGKSIPILYLDALPFKVQRRELALRSAAKKWTMPVTNWKAVLNRFAMVYENRLPGD